MNLNDMFNSSLEEDISRRELLKKGLAGAAGVAAGGAMAKGVAEGFSNDMSTEDMIAYLKQHHDKNLHPDYLNHLTSTNSKFVLKNIPLNSIRTELAGLDRAKVEQYKQMDFSKAPPIVVGSDGNILDGYHRATVAKALGIPNIKAYVGIKGQQGVAEGFPQPGESSGKAKQFNPNAKIQTKEMTLDQILSSVKGIPYVNNVVDDWDAKDYSWGVTKKVIEYAQYLQKNPQSVANLPPLVVIDGQLNDGAHRLSAINLLQKRMDPKNPLWKQVKLKVNFGTSADVASKQGVAEGSEQQYKVINHRGAPAVMYPNGKINKEFSSMQDALKFAKKMNSQQQGVAEGKIKLGTDPNWYGAEVGDYKASGPIVNIPANRLVGFEPDDKMNQPASKANVEKIVAGLKQGAKLPPLLVRQYKNGYQVLDGHHRFWAYKLLGVKSISAQVVPAEDIEEITKQGVAEDVNTGPQIIYATGPRTMGVNDVDLVFKDLRTGKIVAHVVGNNYHPGDDKLQEFAPSGGGNGGGGDDNQPKTANYEIRMGNSKLPTYVAFGDPQQDSKHKVYKLVSGKTDGPTYYGMGMTLFSKLDWYSFLEKMLGEIMWEDDAIEAGLVDRQDDGDLVFVKQQGVAEMETGITDIDDDIKSIDQGIQEDDFGTKPKRQRRQGSRHERGHEPDTENKLDEQVNQVEAYGYYYNKRDQRVMWRKVFPNTEAAYAWADMRNATVLGTRELMDENISESKKPSNRKVGLNENRMYYSTIGTPESDLRSEFNMRKDDNGWYLAENATNKQQLEALRAFGAPSTVNFMVEYDLSAFSGSTQTLGPDNVVSPIGSVPKTQKKKVKK